MSPLKRFVASAAGLCLGAWVVARVGLLLAPPEREAWTTILVGLDTNVLYARLSTADTGLYAGQTSTRLLLLRQDGSVVTHRAMNGPAHGGPDGIASGSDSLTRANDLWHLRIAGDAIQVNARVQGTDDGCPPRAGFATGTLGTTPAGMAGAYEGGEILRGSALVVHTTARGTVRNRALYVLGNGAALAVDPLADCPSWARIGDEAWAGPALPLPDRDSGRTQVGPWAVTWRATAAAAATEAYGHVSAWERALAVMVGWPQPTLRAIRVAVTIDGPGFREPRTGLLLVRGTSLE